jgi:hypothetical protein
MSARTQTTPFFFLAFCDPTAEIQYAFMTEEHCLSRRVNQICHFVFCTDFSTDSGTENQHTRAVGQLDASSASRRPLSPCVVARQLMQRALPLDAGAVAGVRRRAAPL